MDFETSKKQIEELVKNFKLNERDYLQEDEENTKTNFINKFFRALGWDVTNEYNVAPQYRDVVFEDSIIINGKPRAPDYSFRIGGQRKFFVEAKAPRENIENNKEHAFQLKRYTWSKGLPVGLLTDFEELAIYVPKSAPKKSQHPKTDRIKYYHYSEYVENWEEIYNIYSKDAVLHGKFDNYFSQIDSDGNNPTVTVDDDFLNTIEQWREELAKNIANRNRDLLLSPEELNFAVQLIIDRIIFLRIAEDRGIEKYGQLKKLSDLAKHNNQECPVYDAFIELCKKADLKYNSGLFHFTEEDGINLEADTLTPSLHIDDGKLKYIFDNLYYPECPYEFSMISTEILGNIYEQFLGKVIRLTDSGRAKIEDKPEVKKAGGVYYTPQYIVDYIVENTIGELLKRKSPNQVSELKIVDPACGSGSFLLGAYQKLLDWHLEYYSNMEMPPGNAFYIGNGDVPRLTIQEKKRILLNNIYGVDIDSQAVEVTKLSLLLKVLEDENTDIFERQQKLIQERALPYLGDNIKCGNSLIGTDILDQFDLTNEEIQEINPFDWKVEFSKIFENGGFDAVIGNPPYFNIDTWGTESKRKDYIKKNYKKIWADKTDILFYFIFQSNEISKNKLGFIVSNAFLFAKKAEKLRNYILNNTNMKKIVNFEKYMVFDGASITTSIIILDKKYNNRKTSALGLENKYYLEKDLVNRITNDENFFKIKLEENDVFPIKTNEIMKLNKKIDSGKTKLKELFEIGSGMQTGANKIFTFNEKPEFPEEYLKKRVNVSKIKPYFLPTEHDWLLYVNFVDDWNLLDNSVKNYLKENRTKLKNRADKKRRSTANWWDYTFPLHKELYKYKRIYTNYRNHTNEFALDENKQFIGFTNTTVIFDTNPNLDIKYLLSLLNSKVLTFRYQSIGKQTGGGSYEYFENGISKLPIPEIPLEKQQPFIELADKLIELNNQLSTCRVPTTKKNIELQINNANTNINQLVYELYGLTNEEIEIIEENVKIDD